MARFLVLLFLPILAGCDVSGYGYLEFDAVNTSLMRALVAGDLAAADRAIEAGADLNFSGRDGLTPAIWYVRLEKEVSLPVLQFMFERGAQPNLQSTAGYSMMYFAAARADVAILDAVVGAGGDPNLANPANHVTGYPIFNVIASSNMDNLPALNFLIEHGAELRVRSGSRVTPLMFAVMMAQFDLAVAIVNSEPLTRCDAIVHGGQLRTVDVDALIRDGVISQESGQIPFRDSLVEIIADVECPE